VDDKLMQILKNINGTINYESENGIAVRGLFDSLDIVNLVFEIEKDFGIIIPFEELVPENFDNLNSIKIMIKRCIKK